MLSHGTEWRAVLPPPLLSTWLLFFLLVAALLLLLAIHGCHSTCRCCECFLCCLRGRLGELRTQQLLLQQRQHGDSCRARCQLQGLHLGAQQGYLRQHSMEAGRHHGHP